MRRSFFLARLSWDLSTGLVFQPGVIISLMIVLALGLVEFEQFFPSPDLARFLAVEPGAAQVVLGTVAGSMITVVTSVYSILLVALSLASMQFSTRIVIGFLRDTVSQRALGVCVGTFAYALIVLRTVRGGDDPFVPPIAVSLAPVLALMTLAVVVYFIHHVALGIQANHIVDRIAGETEGVIDVVFAPAPATTATTATTTTPPPPPPDARLIPAEGSGYLQLIDLDALRDLVRAGGTIHLLRPMGAFVARGVPVFAVAPSSLATPDVIAALQAACDLGPVRTMQDDAEYGFRQIVDIALKALSPAVNDPSTAATCLDHLGRLLIRVAGRRAPVEVFVEGTGQLVVPSTSFPVLVDLAFDQIRQYSRTDFAVTLRLMRVLGDVASQTSDPAALAALEHQAALIETAARAAFTLEPLDELERRRQLVRAHALPQRAHALPQGAHALPQPAHALSQPAPPAAAPLS